MQQNPEKIEEIVKHNETMTSNFSVWPVVLFFLGLIIAALSYKFALYK